MHTRSERQRSKAIWINLILVLSPLPLLAASTNLPSASVHTVTANTNGVVVWPTNFWSANSTGLSNQIDSGYVTESELTTASNVLNTASNLTATPWRMFYSDGSGNLTELPIGTNSYTLTSQGTNSAPTWSGAGAGDITAVNVSGGLLSGGADTGEATVTLTTNVFSNAVFAVGAITTNATVTNATHVGGIAATGFYRITGDTLEGAINGGAQVATNFASIYANALLLQSNGVTITGLDYDGLYWSTGDLIDLDDRGLLQGVWSMAYDPTTDNDLTRRSWVVGATQGVYTAVTGLGYVTTNTTVTNATHLVGTAGADYATDAEVTTATGGVYTAVTGLGYITTNATVTNAIHLGGTAAADYATDSEVAAAYLPLAGGTMTGAMVVTNSGITITGNTTTYLRFYDIGDGTNLFSPTQIYSSDVFGNTGTISISDRSLGDAAWSMPYDASADNHLIRRSFGDGRWGTIAGETWTGTHDFGGADDLEIPNGANPTTDTTGQIAVDSDDAFVEFFDGTASRVLGALHCETFTISEPDQVADDVVLKHWMADAYPHGVTLKDIAISASGAVSDTHVIEEWDDRAGSTQATVESIALSTSQYQEDDGTLSDSALAADSFLVVNLDDSTDDVDYLEITITYWINQGD